MDSVCPLCLSGVISIEEEISVADLIATYQESIGVPVANEFKDLQKIRASRCGNCDLLFFDPPTPGSEAFYKKLQQFDWYYLEDKNEYDFVSKLLRPGEQVLDVGCGRAAFAGRIPHCNFVGLEFSSEAIQAASTRGIVVLNESVEEHARRHPEKYDVVCAFQVLEHVAQPKQFIEGCLACVKPNGRLIFSLPSADSFLRYLPNFAMDLPPHHVSRWSDAALGSLPRFFPLEHLQLWHEPLQHAHRLLYSQVVVRNALLALLRLTPRNIDRSMPARLVSTVSGQLARVFAKGLSHDRLLPRGASVTSIYRKLETRSRSKDGQ